MMHKLLHEPKDEPSAAMVDQAIAWLTQLTSGQPDPAAHGAYRAWCAADPQHAVAAQRVEKLFGGFDGLPPVPALLALEAVHADALAGQRSRRAASHTRSTTSLLLLLLLVACIAGVPLLAPEARYWTAEYRADTGQRLTVALPDRSKLTLDSQSAVDVQYTATERRIVLLRGEILVDVAHIDDPASQPFVVHTEEGDARALGTRFLVRRTGNSTLVTVLESAVQASSGLTSQVVMPGQRVRMTDAAVDTPQKLDAEQAASWTGGKLVADNMPLPEVLDALARYRRGAIRYDAAQIGAMRVSGVFALDDGDNVLKTLQAVLPVRVRQFTPLLTVVLADKK